MKAVYDAIWGEWDAHAGLKAVMPALYMTEAPAGATMPYGVYWPVSEIRLDTFNTNSEEYLIQIDSYANAWNATGILAIQLQVHDCFDWCALTVAAWNHIYMKRVSSTLQREDDCWHAIDTYQLEVQS